ncbi:hypothetical protein J1605_006606 [Eschrichtius robustus]|uniref:Uncharacterized protein n=1 Tax=Eschrichtius robustus TaxID=9764 RepID=A0AB34GZT9_ESCRO|nr:hypothetical protein J1605_006606 [Eschrichtius robustus]
MTADTPNRGEGWHYDQSAEVSVVCRPQSLLTEGCLWYSTSALLLTSGTQEAESIGTSLVAQWLRIRLPVQGTRVRVLVREDPTCRGATKPVRHNY